MYESFDEGTGGSCRWYVCMRYMRGRLGPVSPGECVVAVCLTDGPETWSWRFLSAALALVVDWPRACCMGCRAMHVCLRLCHHGHASHPGRAILDAMPRRRHGLGAARIATGPSQHHQAPSCASALWASAYLLVCRRDRFYQSTSLSCSLRAWTCWRRPLARLPGSP